MANACDSVCPTHFFIYGKGLYLATSLFYGSRTAPGLYLVICMRFLMVITLSCFFLNAWGQIDFEKGYWINNDGIRNDCLIKNSDWYSNPDRIWYKKTAESESTLMKVSEIKELGVGEAKFIRVKVDIDTSSTRLSELSIRYNPEWKEETLFLRVLLEGKASLYYQHADNMDRYFFSLDNGKIIQLVYKKYAIGTTQVGTNRSYQSQLQASVSCGTTPEKIKLVKYEGRPLTKYFTEYNICNGAAPQQHNEHRKVMTHLRLVPGINRTHYDATASNFRMGLELEMVLPFNKNKWSMVFEPAYQPYQFTEGKKFALANFLAVRYRFFLGANSNLYLNAGPNFGYIFPGSDVYTTLNISAGAGFAYKRFNVEFRQYGDLSSSLLLGFRLF